MLRISCPQCAKPLGLNPAQLGKQIKCPACAHVFRTGAAAAPAPPPKKKTPGGEDEATPYDLAADPGPPPEAQNTEERIDQMVIDAQRQKRRNRAWEAVGMPSMYIKRAAFSACILWILIFLLLTLDVVLANHQIEQAAKSGGTFASAGGLKEKPKYIVLDNFGITPEMIRPILLWLIIAGGFVVAMLVYGFQVAGAEAMKKLENYNLALFSMLIGAFSLNLFGIWGLLVLMNDDVKKEFVISARRNAGISGEALYAHEEEEDEDEEEEEEDANAKRPKASAKRGNSPAKRRG